MLIGDGNLGGNFYPNHTRPAYTSQHVVSL